MAVCNSCQQFRSCHTQPMASLLPQCMAIFGIHQIEHFYNGPCLIANGKVKQHLGCSQLAFLLTGKQHNIIHCCHSAILQNQSLAACNVGADAQIGFQPRHHFLGCFCIQFQRSFDPKRAFEPIGANNAPTLPPADPAQSSSNFGP